VQPIRVKIQDQNQKEIPGDLIAVFDRVNINLEGMEDHETIGVVVTDAGDILERGISQMTALKGVN